MLQGQYEIREGVGALISRVLRRQKTSTSSMCETQNEKRNAAEQEENPAEYKRNEEGGYHLVTDAKAPRSLAVLTADGHRQVPFHRERLKHMFLSK